MLILNNNKKLFIVRFLFYYLILLRVFDVVLTVIALDLGAVELNLFFSVPSIVLSFFALIFLGLVIYSTYTYDKSFVKVLSFSILALAFLYTVVSVSNIFQLINSGVLL